jgi:peptide methionine sulfoxide reductase msrA/msrB
MNFITETTMLKTASLTPLQYSIIKDKATEYPFSGKLTDSEQPGSYLCRQCGMALYRAEQKFHSGCGWPSFDAEIPATVERVPDEDGMRTEILCANCNAHLGHVFSGEGFTPSNIRHCVNSASLDFVADSQVLETEEIILAAGCFWGVQYYLQQLPGVVLTEVGYCGGHIANPSYQQVCSATTGHLEVVRVIFDTKKTDLITVLKRFFEIHDPEQTDGQGPDIGNQYLSAIFYYDERQKQMAAEVMNVLTKQGYRLATTLRPMATFWLAEDYHQDYYQHKVTLPYCHGYTKRF